MSFKVTAAVLNTATGVDPRAKLVLLALAEHCHGDGASAYPSVETMGRYAECSERQARRHLRALEKAGFIEVVRKATQHRPTEYRIIGVWGDVGVRPEPRADISGRTSEDSRADIEAPRADISLTPEPELLNHTSKPKNAAPSSLRVEQLVNRASKSLAPSEPEPGPRMSQWTAVEEGLVAKLREMSPAWGRLTWGAMKRLVNLYGHPALTFALQAAWEDGLVPDSPYAWTEARCRYLAERQVTPEIVDEGGGVSGKEQPPALVDQTEGLGRSGARGSAGRESR